MATNVINIRRFVDVSTGVVLTPTDTARDWGAVLFVQKGEDGASTTIKKYDDLAAVIAAGSNTEAAKAATQFYGTSYAGVVPTTPFYVATIGAADAEQFTTNFTALMTSEDYYLVLLDSGLTDDMRIAAAEAVEGSLSVASHKLFLDDYSADAVNKTLEEDETSVSALTAGKKLTATSVVWSNASTTKRYYSAALAAFFATRKFDTSSRQMCSIAHKAASGVEAVDFTDPAVTVTPTQGYDNLVSKNANAYINVKLVGLTAWEKGLLASGDDISDFVSADYLNYTLTMRVFATLQAYPRIPMNGTGATILGTAINSAFMELASAGVIGPGTSLDGEVFSGYGYKYSIPIPTGVKKANGIWEGIVASALLTGSTKKVVIGNTLKK